MSEAIPSESSPIAPAAPRSTLSLPLCGVGEAQSNEYSWVTQPLLLAVGSVISYLYAYLYELGYCNHFNIPHHLIKLDMMSVFEAAITLVGAFYIVGTLFVAHDEYLAAKRKDKVTRRIALFAFIGFAYLTSMFMSIALLLASFATVILLLIRLRIDWSNHLKRDKLPSVISNPISIAVAKAGFWTMRSITYLAMLAVLSAFWGTTRAWTKSYFLIPIRDPNMVVLRVYGDTMVCAKADLTKHEIYPVFFFYPVTSDFLKGFELRKLNTMKVVDPLAEKPSRLDLFLSR